MWVKPFEERDKKDQPLKAWTRGDPKVIAAVKAGMMLDLNQFKRGILHNFSPYFQPLTDLACKFHKVLFPAGISEVPMSVDYCQVESVFAEAISELCIEETTKGVGEMRVGN